MDSKRDTLHPTQPFKVLDDHWKLLIANELAIGNQWQYLGASLNFSQQELNLIWEQCQQRPTNPALVMLDQWAQKDGANIEVILNRAHELKLRDVILYLERALTGDFMLDAVCLSQTGEQIESMTIIVMKGQTLADALSSFMNSHNYRKEGVIFVAPVLADTGQIPEWDTPVTKLKGLQLKIAERGYTANLAGNTAEQEHLYSLSAISKGGELNVVVKNVHCKTLIIGNNNLLKEREVVLQKEDHSSDERSGYVRCYIVKDHASVPMQEDPSPPVNGDNEDLERQSVISSSSGPAHTLYMSMGGTEPNPRPPENIRKMKTPMPQYLLDEAKSLPEFHSDITNNKCNRQIHSKLRRFKDNGHYILWYFDQYALGVSVTHETKVLHFKLRYNGSTVSFSHNKGPESESVTNLINTYINKKLPLPSRKEKTPARCKLGVVKEGAISTDTTEVSSPGGVFLLHPVPYLPTGTGNS